MRISRVNFSIGVLVLGVSVGIGGWPQASPTLLADEFKFVDIEGELVNFRKAAMLASKIDWADNWGADLLALKCADGKIISIWPTDFGRFFYQDPGLLGKSLRIHGRLHANVPGIDPINVQCRKNGKLHEIYYWCDVCAIRMHRLSACTCCQGPTELRETPVANKL